MWQERKTALTVGFDLTLQWPKNVPLKIRYLQRKRWSRVHSELRAAEHPLFLAYIFLILIFYPGKVNSKHKHCLISILLHIYTAPHESWRSLSEYFDCSFYSLQVLTSQRSGLSDLLSGSMVFFEEGCNTQRVLLECHQQWEKRKCACWSCGNQSFSEKLPCSPLLLINFFLISEQKKKVPGNCLYIVRKHGCAQLFWEKKSPELN